MVKWRPESTARSCVYVHSLERASSDDFLSLLYSISSQTPCRDLGLSSMKLKCIADCADNSQHIATKSLCLHFGLDNTSDSCSGVYTQSMLMQAAKREKHAETGSECEHGVWRCRICNPPQKTRR